MLSGSALLTVTMNLAAAAVAVFIGVRLSRRRVAGPAQRAATLFSVWWIALGIDMLLNTAPKILGAVGFAPLWLVTIIAYSAVAAICVMFWGLVYYLVYLFTGRERAFWPVTLFYGATFVFATAFIFSLRPTGILETGAMQFANEPTPVGALVWSVSLLLPPLLGALAYGTLVVRIKHPFRRYRIALVSTSMFVWFSTALVVNAPTAPDSALVIGLVIGSLALTGLVLAYFPPQAWRRRLGADEADLHAVPSGRPDADLLARPSASDRAAKRAALVARARELV